jgi:uncharacterized protein
MALLVNLRHLEAHDIELKGEMPAAELDLDVRDPMIRAEKPLQYVLEFQKVERSILAQGRLHLTLECQCVRCLKSFEYELNLENWTRHLPLHGEEQAAVTNDCVDLTPYVREDILLELPQHPLCEAECPGMQKRHLGQAKKTSAPGQTKKDSSAWTELDKLEF